MNEIIPVSPQMSPIPSSGLELKNLKQQLLKDAYDVQTVHRSPRISQVNPQNGSVNTSEGSIRSSRSVQLLPTFEIDRQQSIKNMLKQSYEEDITRKKHLKEKERKQIQQEKDILNLFHNFTSVSYDQVKKNQSDYAKILDQQIKQKKQKKIQEKQKFYRDIKESDSIRQQRKMGALEKQNSFKEYFNKINQFRNSVSNDYLKYVEQSPKKSLPKVSHDKQLLENHRKMLQVQYQSERKKNQQRKHQLRTVLENQIMQNRSYKASEQNQYKNRGYIKSTNNVYNPILNPIDYQLDMNNKYIIKEIVQKQSQAKNKAIQ